MIPDVLFFFVFLHLEGALHTVEEKSTLVTFWVSRGPGAAPWAGPVEAGGGCAMVQLVFVEQRCREGWAAAVGGLQGSSLSSAALILTSADTQQLHRACPAASRSRR